jgi:hypothetical protein
MEGNIHGRASVASLNMLCVFVFWEFARCCISFLVLISGWYGIRHDDNALRFYAALYTNSIASRSCSGTRALLSLSLRSLLRRFLRLLRRLEFPQATVLLVRTLFALTPRELFRSVLLLPFLLLRALLAYHGLVGFLAGGRVAGLVGFSDFLDLLGLFDGIWFWRAV